MLVPSWYMLEVYDRVLTSRDANTLLGLSLIAIFLYLIYALLERYRGFVLVTVSEGIDGIVSPMINQKILSFNSSIKGNSIGLISDLNQVKQFLTGQPMLSFLDTPWAFIYLFVIFIIHPMLGFLAIISTVFLFLLALLTQKMTEPYLIESQKTSQQERKLIHNVVNSSESITAMGMRFFINSQLSALRKKFLEQIVEASLKGVNFSSLTKYFRVLIQSGILGYGAYLAIDNQISAGMIIAGSILLGRALSPIEGVINSWKQFSDFKKAYSNLSEIIIGVKKEQHTVTLGRPLGAYTLKDITLNLRDVGKPTLDKVSLNILAGETISIIGPSGAGKTSLLKTIAGVIDPNEGQVLIDGSNLANRDKGELGLYIGYLSQTTDLLAGKVSENIARFNQIESDRVIEAAKLAGAHEMILSLPNGYETILGDLGSGISEGQKRKIALARAFYNHPQVLILDEPGNSLDDPSVMQVGEAIKLMKKKGVTCIFSTHQLNLAKLADKVMLIIDGQIRLFGPTAEVFNKITNKSNQ